MTELSEEARLESHGHFTLHPGKALEHLGRSLLGGPDEALLKLCEWAYFFRPSKVTMQFSRGRLQMTFTPSPVQNIPELDLARLAINPDGENPWSHFAMAANYLIQCKVSGLLLLDRGLGPRPRRLDLVGEVRALDVPPGSWSLHALGFEVGDRKRLLAGLRKRLALHPDSVTWNGQELTGAWPPDGERRTCFLKRFAGPPAEFRLGALKECRLGQIHRGILCLDDRFAANLLAHSQTPGSVYLVQHGITLDPFPWPAIPEGMSVALGVERVDTDLRGWTLRTAAGSDGFPVADLDHVKRDIQSVLLELGEDAPLLDSLVAPKGLSRSPWLFCWQIAGIILCCLIFLGAMMIPLTLLSCWWSCAVDVVRRPTSPDAQAFRPWVLLGAVLIFACATTFVRELTWPGAFKIQVSNPPGSNEPLAQALRTLCQRLGAAENLDG